MLIDSATRQRVSSALHIGDIVYPARASSNALNVDILPAFNQTSPSGFNSKVVLFFGAIADELSWTDVWVEGARKKKLDDLGNPVETTWQRPRLVYKDLSKNSGVVKSESTSKPEVNW